MEKNWVSATLSESVLSELARFEKEFQKNTGDIAKNTVLTGGLGFEKISAAVKKFPEPEKLRSETDYLRFLISLHESERVHQN